MIPFEWVSRKGDPVLEGWDLEANQVRQLKVLMMNLEKYDLRLAVSSLIFKTKKKDVYYSKINGIVALRPRCCVGPGLSVQEREALLGEAATALSGVAVLETVTYLERVDKKGNVERPLLADTRAPERLDEIATDRRNRKRVTLHKELPRKP